MLKQDWLSASVSVAVMSFLCVGAGQRSFAQLNWETEVVDPDTYDADSWEAGSTTIKLDSFGNPWISYVNGPIGGTTFDLKLARFDGNQWWVTPVESDTWGHGSMAIDSLDLAHLSFRRSNMYAQGVLWYAKPIRAGWGLSNIDPTLGLNGPSLTLDSLDRPHVAYGSGAYPSWGLKYAWWTGSLWDIHSVDDAGYQIRDATSIVIDDQGLPHISYTLCCEAGLRLVRYAHWDGIHWLIEDIDSVDTPLSTSIALDSHGVPHIAYTMGGLDGISFASRIAGQWQTELIAGERLWYARLALGSDDEPRIAYYHADHGALMFAQRQAGQWSIQTVEDDPGAATRIGRFPSIAVGPDDTVHISYYLHESSTSCQLKYARAKPILLGDLNCDGAFNGADIDPFFLALGDPSAYALAFPNCDRILADMNGDGAVNGADIDPFFDCLGGGGCP